MRIDPTGRISSGSAPRPGRRRIGSPSFVLPDQGPGEAAAAAAAEMAADELDLPQVPLAAPIAAAAPDGGCDARPQPADTAGARRQGEAVLNALAGIQLAALAGSPAASGDARHALAALAGGLPGVADPELEAVLQAIAQRAAIELARSG
jgi:hypothetical protein